MLSGKRLTKKVTPTSRLLTGISHPLRLGIIDLLKEGPLGASQIVHQLKQSGEDVSYHLRLLRLSGWVKRNKTGKKAIYSLDKKNLKEISDFFHTKE